MKLCHFEAGLDRPFFLIAGPCVVESEQLQMDVAGRLQEITSALGIPFIFKSSYDKANRSSGTSFRGPGMDKGLEILAKVKRELGVPLLTDVHTEEEVPAVAAVVDVLQTPAFLSRQTDFIHAVARSGKPVNIKKGQFLAPHDMKNVIAKARAAAREAGLSEDRFLACERGASFGYNNLVSDMRSLAIMRETGAPVVFDATHSVQLPGGQGTSSGGQREFVPVLARAAAREVGLSEDRFLACERGVSFGYNNLVADMTSLAEMRNSGAPVVFDVTHSVQKPGGQGTSSGGAREMVPVLARAGVGVGVAGLFMETHPNPAEAFSDGPNAVPLKHMKTLLTQLVALDRVVKQQPLLENDFSC